MTKEQDKIFKKLEEILLSQQKEKTGKYHFERNNIKSYDSYEKDDVYHFGFDLHKYNTKPISNDDLFSRIKEHFNDGKPVHLHIRERIRLKSFINLLMRDIKDEKLQDKFISLVFSGHEMVSSDTFDCIKDFVKKNNNLDLNKTKKLSLKIVELVCNHDVSNQPYMYDSSFKNIINSLTYFSFNEQDYPTINKLFVNFSKVISSNYESSTAINNFLKNKIPPKDWEYFNVKKEDSTLNKNINTSLFDTNNNAKYHLIINEDFVLNKFPVLSLGTDYFNMINQIVKHLNSNVEELNLESCKIISTNNKNKKTELYFISKDQNPVNENHIQSVLDSVISVYAESLNAKEPVTNEFLDTTFKAAILASSLNEAMNKKNIEPTKNKIHKI